MGRARRRALAGIGPLRRILGGGSDFLSHRDPPLYCTNFYFFRPIFGRALQFDFENAVVETGLDVVGINPEGELDRAREAAIAALAAMPSHLPFLPRAALALQSEDILEQADRYVVASDARQFGGDENAVVAKPQIDRRKFPRHGGAKPGKDPVHLALHAPQLGKRVEPIRSKSKKRHGRTSSDHRPVRRRMALSPRRSARRTGPGSRSVANRHRPRSGRSPSGLQALRDLQPIRDIIIYAL